MSRVRTPSPALLHICNCKYRIAAELRFFYDDPYKYLSEVHNHSMKLRRIPMSDLKRLLRLIVLDDKGGEVLEYALIAGLIVVAAIAVIGKVGTKVLARWSSLNSSI